MRGRVDSEPEAGDFMPRKKGKFLSFKMVEDRRARRFVFPLFFFVQTDDITAVPDVNFLDLQVLRHLLVTIGPSQNLRPDLFLFPHPAAQDLVMGSFPRSQRVQALFFHHSPVGHDHHPTDAEPGPHLRDHRFEGLRICRIPRENLPRHRPTFPVHSHTQDQLRKVRPMVPRVAALASLRLRVPIDRDAGRSGFENPEFLAELGQALDQRVDRPIGLKPVSASERGQDTLAGFAVLTEGLGDLEVLIKNTVLEATFAGKIGLFKRKPLIM